MVTLKKGEVTAKIVEVGAELKSFNIAGKEYLWHGDSQSWGNSTLVLFPVCGGLKDNRFTFKGKSYNMPKHGFGWIKTYSIENQTEDSVTFLLTEDEETLKIYPFHFEFRVSYKIEGEGLKVAYDCKNTGTGEMYFATGAHEGYYTPEGIEEYDVIFPQKETIDNMMAAGEVMSRTLKERIITESEFLPLYEDHYVFDGSLVIDNMKSRSCNLRNRRTGKEIHIEFPGYDYFLFWHKHGAPYICLEPWGCLPDFEDTDYDIAKKGGMIKLEPGENHTYRHSFTVVKR